MFTGIVEATGSISSIQTHQQDMRFTIHCPACRGERLAIGESISISGVCLTVVTLDGADFCVDASPETLSLTTLGRREPAARVNLERALTLSSRVGGHLVSGHVDGIARVSAVRAQGRGVRIDFAAPAELGRYLSRKGSVCIDGASLTVNDVHGSDFHVQIIPHTLAVTIMDQYQAGSEVNIEVDIIARYLERLLAHAPEETGVSLALLAKSGFTTV